MGSSISQPLKEMHEDIKEIKSDNKEKEHEEKSTAEIKEIRNEMKTNNREIQEIKNYMKTNNDELEKKLTEKVVETLKPRIRDIEVNSKSDLRNLIREELANQLEDEADG